MLRTIIAAILITLATQAHAIDFTQPVTDLDGKPSNSRMEQNLSGSMR
jgi:hypothetical protein